MLGARLEVPDFHADDIETVRKQIVGSPQQVGDPGDLSAWAKAGLGNAVAPFTWQLRTPSVALQRIAEFGLYAADPIVRRSPPLQKTADAKASRMARMNAATASKAGLAAGGRVRVRQGGGEAVLEVSIDAALPDGTVRIARGVAETAALGGEGEISLERVTVAAVA
jgi:NADH-quinone oxidoreductase subunit G